MADSSTEPETQTTLLPQNTHAMKTNRLFSAAMALTFVSIGTMSTLYGQGIYISPSAVTHPSQAAAYNHILMPSTTDTISITAAAREKVGNAGFVYLLEDGFRGTRVTTLDEREKIFLVEDIDSKRIAVLFDAFHTSYIEVKVYDQQRKLVFWKKGVEVFSGEQIVVDYQVFEGGQYFLHVNTNEGAVVKQHIYKPFQAYTTRD